MPFVRTPVLAGHEQRETPPTVLTREGGFGVRSKAFDTARRASTSGITVFVEVRLHIQPDEGRQLFEQTVAGWPEVVECFHMTGDADYLLRVTAPDVSSYHRFLDRSLRRVKGVLATKSSVAMRQVKVAAVLAPATSSGSSASRPSQQLGQPAPES
jgi:DNA-binding Lrp family transcriptional regulator